MRNQTNECGRPGEMSDKLLRRCLEKVSLGAPHLKKKSRATVNKKSRQDHCLEQGRTGTCVSTLEVSVPPVVEI